MRVSYQTPMTPRRTHISVPAAATALLFLCAVVACGPQRGAGTAGSDSPAASTATTPAETKGATMDGELKVTSSAYSEGGRIPVEYCFTSVSGGKNRSIPLEWTPGPDGTKSYVVVMLDQHPMAAGFVHWLAVDIPAGITSLPDGASGSMPAGTKELPGDFSMPGYGGPAAPPGTGDHRYETTVYAVSVSSVGLTGRASAADLERALAGKVLAKGVLNGVFSR